MVAIVETELNVHLIINVQQQTLYKKQWYQHPVNLIRNILVLPKLHLKIVSETVREIFAQKVC